MFPCTPFCFGLLDHIADRGSKLPDNTAVRIQIQPGSVLSAGYHAAIAVSDSQRVAGGGDLLALHFLPVPIPVFLQDQDAFHLGGDGLKLSAPCVAALGSRLFFNGDVRIVVVVIVRDAGCAYQRVRGERHGWRVCSADSATGKCGQQGCCRQDGCEDLVGFHNEIPHFVK